jgi:hypothetical protein
MCSIAEVTTNLFSRIAQLRRAIKLPDVIVSIYAIFSSGENAPKCWGLGS